MARKNSFSQLLYETIINAGTYDWQQDEDGWHLVWDMIAADMLKDEPGRIRNELQEPTSQKISTNIYHAMKLSYNKKTPIYMKKNGRKILVVSTDKKYEADDFNRIMTHAGNVGVSAHNNIVGGHPKRRHAAIMLNHLTNTLQIKLIEYKPQS